MSKSQPVVVVFDDRPLFMHATVDYLRRQPGIEAVRGAMHTGQALVSLAGADVLLLRAGHLGGASVRAVVDAAWSSAAGAAVLVVHADSSMEGLVESLIGTSTSFMDIDRSADALVAAVWQVAGGCVVLPSRVAAVALQRLLAGARHGQASAPTLLTPREAAILRLLAAGVDRSSIAHRLGVSRHTIRTHIGHMMSKLDVHSEVELVSLAHRWWPRTASYTARRVSRPVEAVSLC